MLQAREGMRDVMRGPIWSLKKKNSERKMYIMFAYLFSGIQVGNEENNRFSWSYLRKH